MIAKELCMYRIGPARWLIGLALLGIISSLLFLPRFLTKVSASPDNQPVSVVITGSLQTALGCSSDWDPTCLDTALSYVLNDDVWSGTFTVPASTVGTPWEYKATLNGGWAENYGANAIFDGPNIALEVPSSQTVTFFYDHDTHWITSDLNSRIVTFPGSYQSELGCSADWQPDCLQAWAQDPDNDGIYEFTINNIPAGTYETKAAIDRAWTESYGIGGGNANINFTVSAPTDTIIFRFDSNTNIPTVQVNSSSIGQDNNVAWDGLRHDSRDTLYRTPGGAVPYGTAVTLRFRSFHNDLTGVQLRVYDVENNSQNFYPMQRVVSNVDCFQAGLEAFSCDYWEYTLQSDRPNNFWYRFLAQDGTDTDYYGDNTAALDGGLGRVSETAEDISWSLMFYEPNFTAPSWAHEAVYYQIFPDRFRNGDASNDPQTGDIRYDEPVLKLDWGEYPEGYCRNYADANGNCPWRFPSVNGGSGNETPMGRDYMGGDIRGVIEKLDYLQKLGVTVIYFNPIFDAGSNHSYDTQDFMRLDPYFGNAQDWADLIEQANRRGMHVVLDGVFNHLSSDSAFFDRYGNYDTIGACEDGNSPYRNWFHFRAPAGSEASPCAPSTTGGNDTYYNSWYGFDSIPEINKSDIGVQDYFLTNPNSVSRVWINRGSSGWRMDVMGDPSFPFSYWEAFREIVKDTDQEAIIIGEIWQKDSTLLRNLRGSSADSVMNYRLRDAVLGLLAPGNFDSKGFGDSGRIIAPSEFANRMLAVREDYPDAAFYSLMNLLDSHDTERVLWTLTPGSETIAEREQNQANLDEGKRRLRLASLIQFTMPGAPTVYYGDEVGVTGDDDPDDRRAYPWRDLGGNPDEQLLKHYSDLAKLRRDYQALVTGDFDVLLANDAKESLAYSRKTDDQAVIVAINRSNIEQTIEIPVEGFVPNNTRFDTSYTVGNDKARFIAKNGILSVKLAPLSARVLTTKQIDLLPPLAPENLYIASETSDTIDLVWNSSSDAQGYNVYRSLFHGGGWQKLTASPTTFSSYTDSPLTTGQKVYYIVRAVDQDGNESAPSNEVSAIPHYQIDWANVQWPLTINQEISSNASTVVYGQVYINGVTDVPGATPTLRAQLGYGPANSIPDETWTWIEATFSGQASNNDEFAATPIPEQIGSYHYVYRYTTNDGASWVYADTNGTFSEGTAPNSPGQMEITASADSTAPDTPSNLSVSGASPSLISLEWDANAADATFYAYEILRSDSNGGPYQAIGRSIGINNTSFNDTSVTQGSTYYYIVQALDTSFNRSGSSNQVESQALPRLINANFVVTVPASTDSTTFDVTIAGTLDRFVGNNPAWDPAAVALSRVDSTTWQITLSGFEGTTIEYKYSLGSWDYVEKGASCDELGNRLITLDYGSTGTQTINDTILNWRNVAPCGN
jgi:glycosidase